MKNLYIWFIIETAVFLLVEPYSTRGLFAIRRGDRAAIAVAISGVIPTISTALAVVAIIVEDRGQF